jgi:hypothetical protein
MGPMIGVMMVSQEILMAHNQCQAMTHFELGCVKKFSSSPRTPAKTHIVCSHDTISNAANQFHITPMGPMTVVMMVSQEILMAHNQCQAMTHFELGCVKKFSSSPRTPAKITLFAIMTLYQMLPISFISHPWDQ